MGRGSGPSAALSGSTNKASGFAGGYLLPAKFGKQAYFVIELRRGEEAVEVAKKLRELADQSDEKSYRYGGATPNTSARTTRSFARSCSSIDDSWRASGV